MFWMANHYALADRLLALSQRQFFSFHFSDVVVSLSQVKAYTNHTRKNNNNHIKYFEQG